MFLREKLRYYNQLFIEELSSSCIPFWLKNGIDKEHGGIITCLDREGETYSTDKSVWMQGRTAYMFFKLYSEFLPSKDFLDLAKSCYEFLNHYCIDSNDGRMYFTVTKEGLPLRKRRYYFSETFYIIASAEYYNITGDEKVLENARKYYNLVMDIYFGMQDDPYNITPKTITSTRDMKSLSNPMILLNVNSIMRKCDKENTILYNENSKKLIDDIMQFCCGDELYMLESITKENKYLKDIESARIINPGHSIELSWFLLEEAVYYNNNELMQKAKKIFDTAFNFGWDKEYGGLLYFKDLEGLPVEAYEHDMKLWWPHNEAIIAALKIFRITKDKKYFDIFEKVTKYAFEKFSDKEYGEWFGYLRRDGEPTEPACKGHTYKGPFHLPRMLLECINEIKVLQK